MLHDEQGDLNFSQRIALASSGSFPAYLDCGIPSLTAIGTAALARVRQVL
jgi:hypothetical protein